MAFQTTLTAEIPEFVARMKEFSEVLGDLYERRDKLARRIRDAGLHFQKDLTDSERTSAITLFNKLMDETVTVDKEIRALQIEFISIYEAKVTGLTGDLSIPYHIDASGEEVFAHTLKLFPWHSLAPEGVKSVTPEDLYLMRIVQKLFDTSAADTHFEFIKPAGQ